MHTITPFPTTEFVKTLHANLQAGKPVNLQTTKEVNLQTSKHVSLQTCLHACLQKYWHEAHRYVYNWEAYQNKHKKNGYKQIRTRNHLEPLST